MVQTDHLASTPSPTVLDPTYYNNQARQGSIAGMSEGVTNEQFEAALTQARADGNLSRAHVRRTIRGETGRRTREQLAAQIAELAGSGHTSAQIAHRVGNGEEWVRKTARDYSIDIPADRAISGTPDSP